VNTPVSVSEALIHLTRGGVEEVPAPAGDQRLTDQGAEAAGNSSGRSE
jgi:hypothetical protein